MNRLLVNFKDACVYQSDLNLLESEKEWINDACINFQLARLSEKINQTDHCRVILLDPSVTSYIVNQLSVDGDDLADECLALKHSWLSNDSSVVTLLFSPINDEFESQSSVPSAYPRGNHWSLLLMVIISSAQYHALHFFHMDSISGSNKRAALITANQMNFVMSHPQIGPLKSKSTVEVLECCVPQQNNYYDCGLCTLSFTQVLSEHAFRFVETTRHKTLLQTSTWMGWIEQELRTQFANRMDIQARILRKDIAAEVRRLSSKHEST